MKLLKILIIIEIVIASFVVSYKISQFKYNNLSNEIGFIILKLDSSINRCIHYSNQKNISISPTINKKLSEKITTELAIQKNLIKKLENYKIEYVSKLKIKLKKNYDNIKYLREQIALLGNVKGGTKKYKQKVLLLMEIRKEEQMRDSILYNLKK